MLSEDAQGVDGGGPGCESFIRFVAEGPVTNITYHIAGKTGSLRSIFATAKLKPANI